MVLSLGISSFIGKTMYDAGEFKNIHSHFDGRCTSVYGLNGPEDITILDNGISSQKLLRLGLSSEFSSIIGSQKYLRKCYGLDAKSIESKVLRLLK